jgi:ribosomal protein S6--L-glutamate ligase
MELITDNDTLHRLYPSLGANHCFVGRLRVKAGEEFIIHDLEQRGVRLFPSGLSQILSRSKVAQARLLASFMPPLTLAIFDHHDLLAAVNLYGRKQIGAVVSKEDRKNGGQGIHKWSSVEDVFNQASLAVLPYPFVLQPFFPEAVDIRVIILGSHHQESYQRRNPDNFRNNLHCGGQGSRIQLNADQHQLCAAVMARGGFPYAHIDLITTRDGRSYLGEINLRGGLRGAQVKGARYQQILAAIHQEFLQATFSPS